MAFKISEQPQVIRIYNFRSDTNEYIGSGDVYVPAHTGLPAFCTDLIPPDVNVNMVAVYDGKQWTVVEDHRGKVMYNSDNGEEVHIEFLGKLPKHLVMKPTDNGFMKWDGSKWVKDLEAEKNAAVASAKELKSELMSKAANIIQTLEDAQLMGIATQDELDSLTIWKEYRVLLLRVAVSSAPEIVFPETPANKFIF